MLCIIGAIMFFDFRLTREGSYQFVFKAVWLLLFSLINRNYLYLLKRAPFNCD